VWLTVLRAALEATGEPVLVVVPVRVQVLAQVVV
jgi:hypothetical protein